MKKILSLSILLAFLLLGTGCSHKKKPLSIEEQIERNKLVNKVMTKACCFQKSNSVLEKYFGKGYNVKERNFSDNTKNNIEGYFSDDGIVQGVLNGEEGTYYYSIEIKIPFESPDDWELESLFVKDKDGKHFVYVIMNGKWKDPKEVERAVSSTPAEESHHSSASKSEPEVSISNDDLYAIENLLQAEWDISNASSLVGAESSNVFKVKKESVNGKEVSVSYSLRSTYNGQNKFVDLHGIVRKNSNGSWSVVNLGY